MPSPTRVTRPCPLSGERVNPRKESEKIPSGPLQLGVGHQLKYFTGERFPPSPRRIKPAPPIRFSCPPAVPAELRFVAGLSPFRGLVFRSRSPRRSVPHPSPSGSSMNRRPGFARPPASLPRKHGVEGRARGEFVQPAAASANGNTAVAPPERSNRAATVTVQRESTTSSTSSTGPAPPPSHSRCAGESLNRPHTCRSR